MAMNRAEARHPSGDTFAEPIARAREWVRRPAEPRTAAGARSTPTTTTSTSTTSRSPTTAPCSTRPPPTSPRAASRCWRSSARPPSPRPALARGVSCLLAEQEQDGSWYGRWGMNYIYGTWSALMRAQRRRPAARRPVGAPRGRVAVENPEPRRRLGRGRRKLQARLFRLRAGALHPLADRLGAARPDGGRRGGERGGGARHRLPRAHARAGRHLGRAALHRNRLPAGVLSALPWLCEVSSRCGRWRATATSGGPTIPRWRSACDPVFRTSSGRPALSFFPLPLRERVPSDRSDREAGEGEP